MEKRKYIPNTVVLNLRDDIPLDQDINVAFWRDPSREVVFDLLHIIGTPSSSIENFSSAELVEMDERYYECVSLLLVDCDIEGIDFSTPESTREAFDDERIPWGTFHNAVIFYMNRLMDEYTVLKNALRRVKDLSDSGEKKKKQGDTSAKTSSEK